MRFCLLFCMAGLFTAANVLGTTIQFEVTPLGTNSSGATVDQITYLVSGLTLQSTQELDFFFDPKIYSNLANPVAPSGFTTLVLQPNNPVGTSGDFGVFPASDNTPASGPFSIDVTLIGHAVPGPQPFSVTQFDQNGNVIGIIATGTTSPVSVAGVPEPASIALIGASVALLGLRRLRRRKFSKVEFQ